MPYERERLIVDRIERLGGRITYTSNVGPKWIQTLVGPERMRYFGRVAGVELRKCEISEDELRQLAGLSKLRWLTFKETPLSATGLAYVGTLKSLQVLRIENHELIADADLLQLAGLKNLKRLHVKGVAVTSAGVASLRTALPGCRIEY